MKLEFHGAAKEVGRSCIEIDNKYLLDCGMKLGKHIKYPTKVDVKNIKAVFLSHAHLDHSGALPLFHHYGLKCPIFCTEETRELTKILLTDSMHLQQHNIVYDEFDVKDVNAMMKYVQTDVKKSYDDIKYEFLKAGHIPGASSVFLKNNGKTLLYSGDISCRQSNLMFKCEKMPKVDVMIVECTYGDREHPERIKEEKLFLTKVLECVGKGDSVIIPAFGVGRSQEVMMMLNKISLDAPVYIDGMARRVTNTILEVPRSIRNPKLLVECVKKFRFVKDFRERIRIAKQGQGVFVTTSGMLTGGPVMEYLKHRHNDPHTTILITGYQAYGTNGRRVLDQGKMWLRNREVDVVCPVEQYDFSAHAGREEIINLVGSVNPKVLVLNHGDPDAIESLYNEFRGKIKEVYAPELGEVVGV